jgi:ribosomal protein S18 acetylase RimI-like enzyme
MGQPSQISIRDARPADAGAVVTLLSADAAAGHYSRSVAEHESQFRDALTACFGGGPYRWAYDEHTNLVTTHRAYVAETGNRIVGFVFLIGTVHPTLGMAIENHMLSVAADFRRQGIARQLLRHSLGDVPLGRPVVARCLRESEGMMLLLDSAGFRREHTTAAGTVHFLRL